MQGKVSRSSNVLCGKGVQLTVAMQQFTQDHRWRANGWCALIRSINAHHPFVFRSFSEQLAELGDQRVEEYVLVQIFIVARHDLPPRRGDRGQKYTPSDR